MSTLKKGGNMFYASLVLSLLVAGGMAFITARAFKQPLESILKRIVGELSAAWLKYLQFAIVVVGISSGVRIRDMEKYIAPARGEKDMRMIEFSVERGLLELYRTAIESLQGIAWMLLVFFMFALIAYVIVRIGELKFGSAKDERVP